MARIISKQHAEKIADKLQAKIQQGSKHDFAEIFHGGQLIARFGIRRGSEKYKGHDHIQKDLYLNGYQAKRLAACPLTREEWLEIMRTKGKLD